MLSSSRTTASIIALKAAVLPVGAVSALRGGGEEKKLERTFAMIKPDAMAAGNAGHIKQLIRDSGFIIISEKVTTLSKSKVINCTRGKLSALCIPLEAAPLPDAFPDAACPGRGLLWRAQGQALFRRPRRVHDLGARYHAHPPEEVRSPAVPSQSRLSPGWNEGWREWMSLSFPL